MVSIQDTEEKKKQINSDDDDQDEQKIAHTFSMPTTMMTIVGAIKTSTQALVSLFMHVRCVVRRAAFD